MEVLIDTKLCFIALEYRREYGIDYNEIFALVSKITISRTILPLINAKSWPIFQLNAKKAF